MGDVSRNISIRNFRIYLQTILNRIKNGVIDEIDSIDIESLLQLNFLIGNIFYEDIDSITIFNKALAPYIYDTSDINLSTFAASTDLFLFYFKESSQRDLTNQLAYLFLKYFEFYATKKFDKINYKWISREIVASEKNIDEGFKATKINLRAQNTSFSRDFLLRFGSFENIAAKLKQDERCKYKSSEFKTVLEHMSLTQWTSDDQPTIEATKTLLLVKELFGNKKYKENLSEISEPRKAATKRKFSEDGDFELTTRDFEILTLCTDLYHKDRLKYNWMVDKEKIKTKVLITNSNDVEILKSLDLLVDLKFGKKENLKKDLPKCKQSQRRIRGFVSDEELEMLDWMLLDPKRRKIEAKQLKHLVSNDEANKDITLERRGIKNFQGVSCYCNALLQVLFNLDKIGELISSLSESQNEWLNTIRSIWKKVNSNQLGPAIIDDEFNRIFRFPGMKEFRVYDSNNKIVKPVQGDLLEFFHILLQNLPENFAQLFDVSNTILISTVTTLMADEFLTDDFNETCWRKICDNGFDSNNLLPQYLIIECNRTSNIIPKNKTPVNIKEDLVINNQAFQLNSAIKHVGDYVEGGHYIAYTRNKQTLDFVEYSDKDVKHMNYNEVIKKCQEELYLLIYEKSDNPEQRSEKHVQQFEAMDIDSNEIQIADTSECSIKHSTKVTNGDICKILINNGRTKGTRKCIDLLQTKYSRNFSDHGKKRMTLKLEKLKRDLTDMHDNLPKAKRYFVKILKALRINENQEFVFSDDLFEHPEQDYIEPAVEKVETDKKKVGRKPKTDFNDFGKSKKYDFIKKKVKEVQNTNAAIEVLLRAAKNENKFALARIVKKIRDYNKDNKVEKLLELINQHPVQQMSPAQAYICKLRNNLSIRTYSRIRREVNKYNADVFPPYKSLLAFQKSRMPNTVKFDDKSASISVNELNCITVNSLLSMISKDLLVILKEKKIEKAEKLKIVMRFIWGLDGSTQQSIYHQKGTSGEKTNDSSLMIASMAPVEIVINRENGEYLGSWRNPASGSRFYNRTIIMRYEKETNESITKMYNEVNDQIKEIQGKIVENVCTEYVDGQNMEIIPQYYLTMIDGKVCAVLTKTKSFAQCPVCNAKPTDMNKIENFTNGKFRIQEKAIKHTVSPLHAVINFVRALFNIACRKNINSWRVPNTEKETFKQNRLKYKQALWDHFGVHFDEPRQGGTASSTTGSVCRRLLKDPKKLAEVLELDITLVERLATILKALNCKEDIDGEKFGKYAFDTYKLFIQKYSWFYMPCTMHKVLAHGGEIIKSSPLPVGMMTEEGAEAKNKLFRNFREFLARKMDKTKNNEDVFVRLLFLSDPSLARIFNSESPYRVNKDKLPNSIKMLLKDTTYLETQYESDSDSDSDYDEDDKKIKTLYESEDVLEELENYEQNDRDFDEDEEYEKMVRDMQLYKDKIDYTKKPRFFVDKTKLKLK